MEGREEGERLIARFRNKLMVGDVTAGDCHLRHIPRC